ncbi:hypothetical protein A9G34_00885 [Gilliamella sp. Choc4-2]|uniref:DUF1187 family protein n=1 Tax=Gilliamella sp. Choc4-2 TaxID=3120237 RepID=UPI00080E1077|nr:DUF1187 family protein [Gilliamella apicola]OCG45688.1 hypothetical protein A9G34_00885 [Gilliamella apicola]
MAYKITAEVKKGWQSWGTVNLRSDKKMTERALIKIYSTAKTVFGASKVDVQVRNFQCVRV